MLSAADGPSSAQFKPLALRGNVPLSELADVGVSEALAYLDTVGTRAEDAAYKRMRLVLTSAHRALHNRMHRQGHDHGHTPATDHREHH